MSVINLIWKMFFISDNFFKFQTVLLALRFEEFNWEYAKPSNGNANCLPCLFILFMIVENGARVSKILQIFSRQARLMDTLISYFVTQIKTNSRDEIMKSYDSQITNEHGMLYFQTQRLASQRALVYIIIWFSFFSLFYFYLSIFAFGSFQLHPTEAWL